MVRELFDPPRAAEGDESVASLVERHYGSEMVHRVADPLLSGVYGGEAGSLSVRAVLPRFAEMERTHGSLGRGMLAARRKMPRCAVNSSASLFTSKARHATTRSSAGVKAQSRFPAHQHSSAVCSARSWRMACYSNIRI